MLNTRHNAAEMGIPSMEPWPPDKAAWLMAILYLFGNNEGFTLSPKFNTDREYIQTIYGVNGGEIPDGRFADALKRWVHRLGMIRDESEEDWKDSEAWIRTMYNFKLLR